MTTPREYHEELLIRAFFLPQRQAFYLELLSNPQRRPDLLKELAHFKHLDLQWAQALPLCCNRPIPVVKLLQSKGAPPRCWAISESEELDGKEVDLLEALNDVLGCGIGTFLSCLPGQLAYFEDEDSRYLLERPSTP
jgi:hypothetical protein